MSDPGAPDPIDRAYVEAEAALRDDEAARAARRARILAAVADDRAAAPASRAGGSRRWASGRSLWLAAASVAGLCLFAGSGLYEFVWAPPQNRPATEPAPPAAPSPPAAPTPAPAPASAPQPARAAAPPPRAPAADASATKPAGQMATNAESLASRPPQPFPAAPANQQAAIQPSFPPRPEAQRSGAGGFARQESPPAEVASREERANRGNPTTDQVIRDLSEVGNLQSQSARGFNAPPAAAARAAPPPPPAASPPPPPPNQPAALRAAAAAGRTAEVESLLAQGVAIDTPDANGDTALMLAIRANRPAVAAILRRGGASLDRRNNAGERPRDIAKAMASPELNQALGLEP